MKENTFVVTVNTDGKYNTKMYSEEDYNTKVVPFLSERYTPDQYSVAGLQDTTADNITEDGQYIVSVDANGATHRKTYTGKELLGGKLTTIGQQFPDYRLQYVDGAVRPAEGSDEIIAVPWQKQMDAKMAQLNDNIGKILNEVDETAVDVKDANLSDLLKERGDAMTNFANMAVYNGLTKTPEELEAMHQEDLDRRDLRDINKELEDVNNQLAEWAQHESEVEDFIGPNLQWILDNATRKDELLTRKAELIQRQTSNPYYKREDKRLNEIADNVLAKAYPAMADLSVEGDLITPNNPEADVWQAARYFADKAKTTLSAPDNNANGFVSFLKGHGATFSDADFWLAGLESIASNMKVKKVFDSISSKLASYADQNIEKELTDGDLDYLLSDAEKQLLLSFVTASEAEALRAQNTNNMYKAGLTSANSLGFMAQFILTGGIGDAFAAGTKGAAKGLAIWLAKNTGKVGRGLAIDAAVASTTLAGKGALATADAVVTPLLKSIPMTLMQTGLYKDYAQKLTERDEAGNLKYDYDTAVLPALRDAGLEVWSEMALEPVLSVFGKTMGIGLDKLAGKSKIAAMFNTKLDDLAKFFHNREAMEILTKAGFDGYFEEIGEEILGAGVSSLWEPEAWSQFWEKDNLVSMAVAFAPMSIIGGGMSMANYVKREMAYDEIAPSVQEMLARRGVLTDEQISELFNRDVNTMQDVADKISGIINPIIESGNITAEEFKTLYDFAGATAQKDIASALVKRAEEDRRIVMRNEMDQRMNGKQYTGKDAEGNETISFYEDEKGNRRYVVVDAGNTDGLSLSMDENGKDLKIVNINELEVTTMGANAFFDNMWKEGQAAQESQRMQDDAARQRQSVAQALKSGKPVQMYNSQTNEREDYVFLGWNGEAAVMANAKTGVEEERSIQDLANALHISDTVLTDAQREQAQIDELRKNDSIARSANDYKGAPVNFNGVSGTLLRLSSRGDENGNSSLVASIITSNGELVPVNVTADMVEDFIQERKDLAASGNAAAADRRTRDHERKEQQRKDSEAYRSSKEKYTNPDGSVREGEFLENDPRGFAMYSDGKYGKADTDATLAAALANAQTKAQQALLAKEAEANPDVKAGLRDEYQRAVAALDTLDTLLNERHQDESSNGELAPDAARVKYQEYENLGLSDDEIYELGMRSINEIRERIAALPVPAVSTDVQSYIDQKKKYSEAVAAEQKKIDYWRSILSAPMTESEKKDVARANARMQRRVADIMAEKAATKDAGAIARLDKELKDVAEGFIGQAIADINTEGDPVVISTAASIEKDMRDAGSTERAIANVLSAIQEGYEPRGIFDPASGAIFFIADYNTDVAEARTTFIHERQHKRTREAGLAEVLIDRLGLTGRTEDEKKAVLLPELAKLIGTSFYDGKSARDIANEIISYSVEHEFNGVLDSLGLNDIITNFAKNIDNERSNAAGLSKPGRNGNVNESYRVADQRDERAQEAESGAVAGQRSGSLEGGEETVGLTEQTQKELAEKGLVMDGGVVMASALSDLKQATGYLTPNEISPEVDAVAFSIRTKKAWAENYRKYPGSEERVIRALENLAERMAADELVSGVISQGDYKYGKKANGSFAGPLRTNIEYVVTFDIDTTCPRTFQYLNYVKQIEKRIGRPLTQTECIQLTEMMRMYGQQIPCVYCYSENKRQAMKQYYTDFMTSRQAVLNAETDEEALEHMYGHDNTKAAKESKDPAVALTEAAFKVFTRWRSERKTAYNPSLKMLWYQYANDRNVVLTVLDQLYADGRIMTDINDDTIAAIVDTELRINDPAAVKVVEDIVSEWKWDAIEGRQHSDYTPVDEDEWVVDPRTLSLWREMTSYAKSASQAKSVLRYVPYTDELKKLSQEQKDYINGMGGVRMHSSNDFRIDYVFDYFQFMADMAANKMFGHTYTKSPEFVRIFGNSGYKINMSIAAYEDENGNIRMNEDEGFNWDEAKRLREEFPNAGVMLMATSDNQIQMALDSDWIDMFIPFHSSSLPKAVWYNMRMWQDYSTVQNEAFLNGDEMKAALIADGVELPKKIKAADVEQMYLDHFKIKTIIGTTGKKKGKRLRPHFLPGPTVVDGQYVPGHNNDPELYKQLCMEYGVHPRFYGVKVKDAQGNTIDITEHPNYIKCIKETARTDSPQTAIQFNFDQPSEALGGKTPIEYAFDELQVRAAAEMEAAGAPVRDIYKSLEKDTFGIVPQFIDTIIKHKETTGKDYPLDYLTPDSRKWFLTERKALEEAYKDVETIPYHRNEYDINGEPMMRVASNTEDQAEIQKALDIVNGVKTFQEEGGDVLFSIRTKPAPKNTGIGYKVFYLKDGKLYPPMVANPNGADTPIGVWLDADAAPQAATSKTGRKKVKAGGKGTQGGSGTLAYRPGWHLGEIPYALQFNRGPKVDNPLGITGKNGKVIKVGKYFPANFVWAEVEYAKDVDYQDEAMSYGYNEAGNFQHSLAGLPKVPEDGSYTYRTNANPATDPWIITGAMKVNRILTDSEVDELVRQAGREPQEREVDEKAFEERMSVVNRDQKRADGQYADAAELDVIMFRLSNNNRATISKWLDKWAEARVNEALKKDGADVSRESVEESTAKQKDEILNYLDKLNDSTIQLAWARWFCTGAVQMGAEDMPKVRQAVKIAKIHKVDPLQYDSPMSIINQWPESVKEDPINPDEVPTLHKVKELPDGFVIYDVDESEESRKNMREIINTHFGKDCSPWCLLQGDGNGKLTKYSADYWYKTYTAYTKQVAFKNGKLVAFSANNSEDRLWWDRQDSSHHGIPVIGKIKGDKLGRSATMEYSPEDGSLISVTNIVKGNRKDGKYMEWFSLENETPRVEETFDHGYLVGRRVINYENGQIRKDENYENGSLSGRAVTYFQDGQIETDANYVSGRLDGPFTYYHENGQVYYTGTYERGDKVGRWQTFYNNGQISQDEVYAKSWKPLDSVTYYPDGSKKSESHSVSRPYGFGTVSEQEWDEQGRLVRSVRMMESSASHGYYDGDLHEITEYDYTESGVTIKKIEAYQGQRGMTLYSALYFDDVLQKETFTDKAAYNYNDVIYDERYNADGKLATVTVQKLEKYNGDVVVDQLKYEYDEDGNVSVKHFMMPRGLGYVKDEDLLVSETRDLLPGETIPSVGKLYQEYQAKQLNPDKEQKQENPAPAKRTGKSIKDTVEETLAAANLFMDEGMEGDITIGGTVNGEEYSFIVFDDFTYEDFLANGYTEDELGRATPEQEEAYAKVGEEIDYYQTNGYWRDEADGEPMFRTADEREKLFKDAKDEFGTTRDFREAEYLLPDGSMLDFSEKNNGGEPGRRGADHRDIARVINDRSYDTKTEYLDDFINEGAIRLIPESGAFSVAQQPTKEQKNMLRNFIYRYNGEVEVEIYKNGHSVADPYYRERTSPTRVLNDIDAYFKDGTIPEGNAPMFRMVEITPETRQEMEQIEAIARVNGTYLKAPNGADTNLNPEQWAMVRTDKFKAWFGDWENDPENASKVVDENGEPKVMYHGTPWNPNEEKPGKAEFKSGWFTGMKRRAEGYGEPVAVFINIKNPAYSSEKQGEFAPIPESFDLNDTSTFGEYDGYISFSDYPETPVLSKFARRRIQMRNPDNYEEVIAQHLEEMPKGRQFFSVIPRNPNQIKSATENNGEFSSENDDIRFRVAYHGTKADFNRFSTDYVLDGEGAVAHGWGIYLSFDEDRGRAYADKVATIDAVKGGRLLHNAKPIKYRYIQEINDFDPDLSSVTDEEIIAEAYRWAMSKDSKKVANALFNKYDYFELRDMDKAASRFYDVLEKYRQAQQKSLPWYTKMPDEERKDEYILDANRFLYKVNVPEDNGTNYIDEQKQYVGEELKSITDKIRDNKEISRDIIEKLDALSMEKGAYAEDLCPTGGEIYRMISEQLGKKRTSEILNDAGFIGIKYDGRVDGNCVVIFNDNDVQIEDKVMFRITPEVDEAYKDAVDAGDMQMAQSLVDAAAESAMADSQVRDENGKLLHMYHGTRADEKFYVFDTFNERSNDDLSNVGSHFGPKGTAQEFSKDNLYDVYLNLKKVWAAPFDFFADNYNNAYLEVLIDLRNSCETPEAKLIFDRIYDVYPILATYDLDEISILDEFNEDEELEEMVEKTTPSGAKYRGPKYLVEHRNAMVQIMRDMMEAEGFDGISYENWYEGGQNNLCYVALYPSQIKSAEAVTYDNQGNMIPLSQRFTDSDDIRFRISGENVTFAEEDANELANDIANEVYRQISSQENSGNLATEVDSESDGEVLFRFIGELGADRLDKTDGGRRILNLIEVKKYYTPDSAENIKRAYGWELDKDAKGNPTWKYEENDFGINDLNIKDGAKLSDVINDEGLFAAYPELKNYTLAIEKLKDASGYFDESNKKIVIGEGAEKEDDRLTLIHEIQHFIQSKEGWVRGTNNKAALILDTVKDILPYIRKDLNMFLKSAAKRVFNKSYKKESIRNFSLFKDKWGFSPIEYLSHLKKANYLAYEAYLRKAGEVEARNAEKRADMTALERRRSLAPETEDRPRSRQWRKTPYEDVMFRIGPAAEMKKKGMVEYLTPEQLTEFTDRALQSGFTADELSVINDRAFEMGGDYSVPVLEHFARLAEKDNLDAHDNEIIEKARQSLVSIIGAKDETFDQNDMLWVAYDAVHGDEEGIYNQIHNRKVKRALDEASSVEPDLTLADYLKKAAEAKDDLIAQYTALRELANNLTRIMDAMSARRDYDRVTVGKLVSLTDDILTSKLMDDVTNGEIKRLTSIIRRSNGMRDIQSRVNELYNLILSNNLRRLKGLFEKELKKKAVKIDSNNVVNQGALDLNGQIAMSAMKENLDSFSEDPSGNIVISQTLADKIADALDRTQSEDAKESKRADMELLGLVFARDYIDGIVASEKEEQQLRDALKEADEALRKGNMNQLEHLQFVKEQTRALAECRTERVGKFTTLLQKMQDLSAASHELALMMNEKDKERIAQIHHDANSDMQGVPSDEHPKDATFLQRLSNNPFTQFFFRPLATFDQMLRLFGNKSVNGEGYLWNRFMRGWIDATGKEYKALQAAYEILDDKVSQVFGKKMRWSDLYSVEAKMPKATIRFWDGGIMKEHELTQGNLLYIMLADQMTDGRMKLRAMGITEEDVDAIRNQMDARFIDLADWIVNDFLPSRREAYNEVHERMFGASMSKVQNYFPLKVLSNARTQQVDVASASTDPSTPSTVTGSIMKRTRNALALDIMGTDAFSLVIEHVQKMEHWAAFAEWNRDLSDLLSYKRFRNQVQNMTSIYGSQRNLWTEFVDTAMIAAGSYKGKSGKLDPAFNRMAKGVTAAKISLRVFTAIKQFLSFPAYFSEANPVYLAAGFVKGWNWSMDNLPLFEKRWKSRQAGDHILAEGNLGKINEYLARIGMTPNALVDAYTVSIGAYAIYKTKYDKYIKMGFSPEAADKRAKQDAVILYNETQQSSEAAFMSSMQSGRSTLEKMFTVFRNSSMGYQRQVHDALRNYKRRLTPGYKKDSIEYMTKQLIREGLTEGQAMKAAKGLYARQGMEDMTRLMIFGYGLQFFWNLAPYLPYLLFGDDDDKKKEMLVDAAEKGVFGSLEGLTGGNLMSEAGNLLVFGEGLNNWDPSLLPLVSDFTNLYQEFGKDNVRAMNDLLNLGIQMGIGVNPQTLEDAVVAIIDACNGDLGTAKEAMLLGLRLISAPQTSLDQLYLDEIDMSALEAKGLTIPELAERYAKYKKAKGAGAMAPLYSLDPALDDKITAKYLSSFENKAKERLDGIESDGMYAEIAEQAKAMDKRIEDLRKRAKSGDEDAERELMEIFLSDDFGPLIMFNELSKDVKTAINNAVSAPTREEMLMYLDEADKLRSRILENFDERETIESWFRGKFVQYTKGFMPEMARLEKKYSDEYAKANPKYQEWMDKHQQDLDSAADKAKANAERVAEIDAELKKYEIELPNGKKRYFNQPARKKLQEEKKALREEGTTEKAYLNKLKKQEGFTPEDFMPPAIYNSPEFQTYLEFKSLGSVSGNNFKFKTISEWETKMNESEDPETRAKYREKIDERMIILGQQITRKLNGVDDEDDGFSLDLDSDLE